MLELVLYRVEWVKDAQTLGNLCGKCSWKEHSPWHLVKEAAKVRLLIPLVKKQIKHYQGSEETHRKCSLWFTLDTCKYHFLNRIYVCCTCWKHWPFISPAATLNRRSSTSESIMGPSCHLSLNAYVHPLNEDSIGQLIEQYPGSDKRAARSNSAQWCHLVLPLCDPAGTLQ